ncbi:HAD family hydrolase [Legionella waltersii]|uniref:Hydrolase n=1 Tax=Legionella waltersii TaxID=66969 RepID=A0A0W1AGP0_9GAMM|nr:HAD-IA family hydrolase [Legionella waltersii]KTD80538.1 hydrolase [Legionella waltersii]SNV09367.1 hydrolase (haloacid dehalogenase family) [Legionella waltersii]
MSSNAYELVIFDWEGTIADTLGVVLHTISSESIALGFGELDMDKARQYANLGLVQAVKKLFPKLSTKEQEDLMQAVQNAMVSRHSDVSLIPGVMPFIKQLVQQNIQIAIATNKGHQSLLRALQATGLDEIFKVTRSAGQVPAKPCPQMLEEIMEEFNQTPDATLMIGDSVSDMEMATGIHVSAIGVDFYHQQSDALKEAGAMAVFDDYTLLAEFLKLPKG